MSLSIELTGANIPIIMNYISNPINKTETFFQNLASYFSQQTNLTFQLEGARGGHPKWKDLSLRTIMSRVGTRKLRYGTDMKPTRTRSELATYRHEIGWGWGRSGFMPGYTGRRRYDTDSKILQASGSFKQSFRPLAVNRGGMIFGSNYISADGKTTASMIAGKREVLFITPMDKMFITMAFKDFYEKAKG